VDASALLAILLDEPDTEFYPFEDSGQVRMQSLYGEAGEKKSAEWMKSLSIVLKRLRWRMRTVALEAFGGSGDVRRA
jgi:uncharacterized protein with PIN domain